MNSREAALAIIRADIATGKATKRSLGVLYALVMAGASCEGKDFWRPLNDAIIGYGGGDRFAYLEGVKKIAWSIFEEVGRSAQAPAP